MIDSTAPGFWADLFWVMLEGTGETLYMVGVATVLTVLVGLPLGIVLVGTERGGFLAGLFGPTAVGAAVNRVLTFVVNLGRSVPFIILMIALIPLTRVIVGTFVGSTAAIVPLTVVAIPFFARLVEIAVKEVDSGLYEVADSLGATRWQLVRRVLLTEAMPAIVLGLATTVTSIINFSAMVGVVGGGGLGQVAVTYGYQRYSGIHIVAAIVILFVVVQLVQGTATLVARAVSHRAGRESPSVIADGMAAQADVHDAALRPEGR